MTAEELLRDFTKNRKAEYGHFLWSDAEIIDFAKAYAKQYRKPDFEAGMIHALTPYSTDLIDDAPYYNDFEDYADKNPLQ